uniref:DNA-directed RNA polymerase III subunit RPC5 isoform X2 n=1 Tax=Erigeron canadensis TaxID=72917 RepID=UPI001CB8D026|nr:DNA-directed RNA polymerase III subunit RPC5 isoform X2 [Erigeron canadensis]
MDIDFQDLDGPSKAPPTKTGKFAPKNSKFKPVAKPKLEPEPLPVPISPAVPKIEPDDSKPPLVNSTAETEKPAVDANGSLKTDTDDHMFMEIDNDNHIEQEDEEDIVVREIDVFYNSSLDSNSKLCVWQYPLRPIWRPYELEERCETVRVNQETADVEVEMSVQVDSENFDAAANDDRAMTKQVLSSAWQPPTTTRYAVGLLMGNELHLNHVHAAVQLRPSMQHLKHEHPSKKLNTTRDEDIVASLDIKHEKATKQSKPQSKVPGAVNEQSADTKEWIPLKYHGEASQMSRGYIQKMVAQQASEIQFSMTQSDYIDSLCPITIDKTKPTGPSRSTLLKLPLVERFKTQLLEGPPVQRFNVLKHIAPDHSEEDIFKVLQEYAHLVQGLWIAKSTLRYGKNTGRELLIRDYVLLQFSKSHIFREMQLPKSTQFSDAMKGVLDEFAARRDSCRDWKFKESPDDSFIKKYSNIAVEQRKNWDRVEPIIIGKVNPKNLTHSIGDRRPASSASDVTQRTTTNVPPRRVMQDETREALPKALQKLFQTYKVCSFNQIRQRLRDMAVSENTLRKGTREARVAAEAADAPQEELQKVLNEVAVNIHGVFVLRSSADHPQYDELRKIVINLLLAEGPEGKLKKASIYAAANMQLKREITSGEYHKVLNDLCVSKNSAWVLKSGDGPT